MIMTPLTTTNQIVIHPVSFTHQCEDQSAIRGTLDVILFVQIAMCIGILTLVKRLSPSCPPKQTVDNLPLASILLRMNLKDQSRKLDAWCIRHWKGVVIMLTILGTTAIILTILANR